MDDKALTVQQDSRSFGLMDYTGALEQASDNIRAITKYVEDNFVDGVDYGPPFPGSDKPTLLLPGAQKFNLLFNARPEYELLNKVEDYNTGFCLYHFRCRLVNKASDVVLGEGEGSCNSYESKYRWRNAERTCPVCGKSTIKKSRFPPRDDPDGTPGWYCYEKIGGCGANFTAKDPSIAQQEVGRIPNPDIFDTWNTVLKISMKRSAVSAAHSTGGLGALFTQDAEDFVDTSTGEIIEAKPVVKPPAPKATKQPVAPAVTKATPTAEVEPATVVSAPSTFPTIEPTDTGDFIHEITLWNGAKKPANGLVGDSSYAVKFSETYVGKAKGDAEGPADDLETTGKWNPKHLTNHLRSHFKVDFLNDLTWEKFNALVKYTLASPKHKDPRGAIDPKYYTGEIAKAVGDAVTEVGPITAEAATTDPVAITERWNVELGTGHPTGQPVSMDSVIRRSMFLAGKKLGEMDDGQRHGLWLLMDAIKSGAVKPTEDDIVANLDM